MLMLEKGHRLAIIISTVIIAAITEFLVMIIVTLIDYLMTTKVVITN